jgi:hypothetical protein
MGDVRVGAAVGAGDGPGGRRCLKIIQTSSEMVFVEDEPALLGLGPERARAASGTFGRRLRDLSRLLNAPRREVEVVPAAVPPPVEGSLRLSDKVCNKVLGDLRDLGAPLRGELSDDVVRRLRLGLDEPGAEPPALTFVQDGARPPILWEMMYEDDPEQPPTAVEWQRFWGFRVPVSHWLYFNRAPRIRLRHGLFFAVSEDLAGAHREVGDLGERLRQRVVGARHHSLATAFRDRVRRDLLRRMKGDGQEVDTWWGHRCPNDEAWLCRFLDEFSEDRDGWKKDALVEILRDAPHELIHFACHCEASTESQFLSRLEMLLAGERVSLDVGLIAMKLRRKLADDEPGPLVFLNACGSARSEETYEPPGFPDKWIKHRGALAVVATLCSVPDPFASAFAAKFYEHLFGAPGALGPPSGLLVAEALLATRRYFMEQYNNPLGLAYVLYATRGAYLAPDPAAGGGSP